MPKPLTPVGLRLEHHAIRPLSNACYDQYHAFRLNEEALRPYGGATYVATLWLNRMTVDALNNEDFEGC